MQGEGCADAIDTLHSSRLPVLSMSAWMPGHQMKPQASNFIRVIPKWVSCNSFNNLVWPIGGITTLNPHKVQLSSVLSSSLLL